MLEKEYAGFTVDAPAEGICVVGFNRPERLNGFDWAVKRDLIEAVTQLAYDAASRVVIFTGGENFSAGDNIGGQSTDLWKGAKSQPVERQSHDSLSTYSSLRTISQAMIRQVRNLDKLTIAAIDGYALQSGLSLALACDFRIATARARLGSATLRMGYLPDEGGHFLIVQSLGVARAKDFLLRKRIVDGAEALALGLVNEVVPPAELMARALALAEELAEGPQTAMRLLKHAIDNAADMTFEQACMDIAVRTAISDHHPDAKEGAAAFLEKPRRKPRFNRS